MWWAPPPSLEPSVQCCAVHYHCLSWMWPCANNWVAFLLNSPPMCASPMCASLICASSIWVSPTCAPLMCASPASGLPLLCVHQRLLSWWWPHHQVTAPRLPNSLPGQHQPSPAHCCFSSDTFTSDCRLTSPPSPAYLTRHSDRQAACQPTSKQLWRFWTNSGNCLGWCCHLTTSASSNSPDKADPNALHLNCHILYITFTWSWHLILKICFSHLSRLLILITIPAHTSAWPYIASHLVVFYIKSPGLGFVTFAVPTTFQGYLERHQAVTAGAEGHLERQLCPGRRERRADSSSSWLGERLLRTVLARGESWPDPAPPPPRRVTAHHATQPKPGIGCYRLYLAKGNTGKT